MDFENTIKQKLNSPYKERDILKNFSEKQSKKMAASGDATYLHQAELASIGILMQTANDTRELSRIGISKTLDPDDLLEMASVKIAAVVFNRHDIVGIDQIHVGDNRSDKTFYIVPVENGCAVTEINSSAEGEYSYDQKKFQETRLTALRTCLDAGANIISFGEFDYPPLEKNSDTKEYDLKIQELIDSVDHEVFLVAGTRHDWHVEGHCTNGQREKGIYTNEARIFTNKLLRDVPASPGRSISPLFHTKKVAATKAGERLSPVQRISLEYYGTRLGNIGVLICVDAYNPTTIFSLLSKRSLKENKRLDFILVPSYNFSPKLYYACQVMSLLCRTTVLLIDTCSHCSKGDINKPQVALFINGVLFENLSGVAPKIGDIVPTSNKHTTVWNLDIDSINESILNLESYTPFIDSVETLLR